MIPLIFANTDEEREIQRIGGKQEVKKHLESLGFVVGGNIKIVSRLGDNLIVKIKETSVALSRDTAQKIMV